MGKCAFDLEALAFGGTPAEQAKCLLNPVQPVGRLGPPLSELPAVLAGKIGGTVDLPSRETLRKWLTERNLDDPLGASLTRAVSQARENERNPAAGDLLRHPRHQHAELSAACRGRAAWTPIRRSTISSAIVAATTSSARTCSSTAQAQSCSHMTSRVPWRATKFEMATNFGSALKGLFLHIELIQPRRRDPKFGRGNDYLAPQPGFTPAQYDALAVVYTVASVRAGFWMIPAFHAVLDEGIRNKHDDPQNFELDAFAGSFERLLIELKGSG